MIRAAAVLAALIVVCAACRQPPSEPQRLPEDPRARSSYSIGLKVGSGLAEQPLDLDLYWVERGIRDALAGTAMLGPAQTDEELQAAQSIIRAGDANATAGEALRSENRNDPDVTELDSGVQYRVVSSGTDTPPRLDQRAILQYRVSTPGGRPIRDLFEAEETETVRVGDLIPGLIEVLTLMSPESRWVVAIPPGQAYGERGRPPFVGPNVTLVFDLLLLGIDRGQP
ncbi:MAG: FKBP-type peptidyl-prolyl cis-trans isomerase [Spirochaetaceae bacterium]|nr:FKBP-type peptidyl-prolyl cis-trans isomerase [Spirochaetaceae bacterium]